MIQSQRKVLSHLRNGGRIWAPQGSKMAFLRSNEGVRVLQQEIRVSTLKTMEEAGLVETRVRGDQYCDVHWYLKIRSDTIGYFLRTETCDEIGTIIGPFQHCLKLTDQGLRTHDGRWIAYRSNFSGGWHIRDEIRSVFDLNEAVSSIAIWAESVATDAEFIQLPSHEEDVYESPHSQ